MKLLMINGVNLNMLGIRGKDLYGEQSYGFLKKTVNRYAKTRKISVRCKLSNYEGKIVEIIQKAYKKYDGIIINAGAYTHTSIAILDALKSVGLPTVEVHLTNIQERDEFRKKSFISLYAEKVITGKGIDGYIEAIDFFINERKD